MERRNVIISEDGYEESAPAKYQQRQRDLEMGRSSSRLSRNMSAELGPRSIARNRSPSPTNYQLQNPRAATASFRPRTTSPPRTGSPGPMYRASTQGTMLSKHARDYIPPSSSPYTRRGPSRIDSAHTRDLRDYSPGPSQYAPRTDPRLRSSRTKDSNSSPYTRRSPLNASPTMYASPSRSSPNVAPRTLSPSRYSEGGNSRTSSRSRYTRDECN